ncbi:uncharacterized protein LOC123450512 [Hordeum vulgare subsp. vulgare]|uniref:uncharacterized protein LOC123450512 n=1 Tax=Hordeum vulgare subsp. vulgare TaxID=112509 RepID=UPI001D1A3F3A|nr:uncharacterized protein LOC123450512 [Hordeum vulgare subsp. vulgare]
MTLKATSPFLKKKRKVPETKTKLTPNKKKNKAVAQDPRDRGDSPTTDIPSEGDVEPSRAEDVEHVIRRHTRRSSGDLVVGLPNKSVVRKRHNEVPHSPTPSLPKVGLIRQPLTPSNSNYRELSHSLGDSTTTKQPPRVINHGAKAKTRKIGDSSINHEIHEMEDSSLVTPEVHTQHPEDQLDDQEESSHHTEQASPEAMDAEANRTNNLNPPSPCAATKYVPSLGGTKMTSPSLGHVTQLRKTQLC